MENKRENKQEKLRNSKRRIHEKEKWKVKRKKENETQGGKRWREKFDLICETMT